MSVARGSALPRLAAATLALLVAGVAPAQEHGHGQHDPDEHAGHRQSIEHSAPAEPPAHVDHSGHAGHASPSPGDLPAGAAPLTPVPPLTDADRAAAFPELHHPMFHDHGLNGLLLVDRLEAWNSGDGIGQAWELEGWLGGDIHRLWLRSEGERAGGRTHDADLELLYGRGVSAWWDVVAGLRHDFGPGDSRSWAAFGVQGLMPYRFDTRATAYVAGSGQVEVRMEVEYELLLTNRLILQPVVEANALSRDEPRHGLESGFASAEAGLRLRYEFSRRFAPYVGFVQGRALGDNADLLRARGEPVRDSRWVFGVRTWF